MKNIKYKNLKAGTILSSTILSKGCRDIFLILGEININLGEPEACPSFVWLRETNFLNLKNKIMAEKRKEQGLVLLRMASYNNLNIEENFKFVYVNNRSLSNTFRYLNGEHLTFDENIKNEP